MLDYIGVTPTKEFVVEDIPETLFDYSELEKYGFGVSPSNLKCD